MYFFFLFIVCELFKTKIDIVSICDVHETHNITLTIIVIINGNRITGILKTCLNKINSSNVIPLVLINMC